MTSNEIATSQPRPPERKPVHVPLNQPLADMDQAWRLAQAYAAADIVPNDLRGKPANVFLIMTYGLRLGLPPDIAINTISVVKGRPRMAGQLLLAKVREAGHKPVVVHGDGQCAVTITRGDTGEEHTETFTLDDAVTARLCSIKEGKPYARSKQGEPLPWESYPKRMLQWRAVGACVDILCPEIRMGFLVEDELAEPERAQPSLAQVAAERVDQPTVTPEEQPEPAEIVPAEPTADELAELAAIAAEHAPADDDDNRLLPNDPDLIAHQDGE